MGTVVNSWTGDKLGCVPEHYSLARTRIAMTFPLLPALHGRGLLGDQGESIVAKDVLINIDPGTPIFVKGKDTPDEVKAVILLGRGVTVNAVFPRAVFFVLENDRDIGIAVGELGYTYVIDKWDDNDASDADHDDKVFPMKDVSHEDPTEPFGDDVELKDTTPGDETD